MRPRSYVRRRGSTGIGVVASLVLVIFLGGGCSETEPMDSAPLLLTTAPSDGSHVRCGRTVTLTFDSDPGLVTVSGVGAQGSGRVRTFEILERSVYPISWGDGSTTTLTFVVLPGDITPPELVSVTPAVLEVSDVDPSDLNDGLVIEFDKRIDDHALTISTDGAPLDWVAEADGKTVTLYPNPDDPILLNTRYEVAGTVYGNKGNETDVAFCFRTYIEPL